MRRNFSVPKTLLLTLVLTAGVVQANTQESEKLHQRTNAAMCANCHGSEGRTVENSAVPPLAGLPRD